MTPELSPDKIPEILMTIPGPWRGPVEFAEELAGKGGYLLQGDRITNVVTRQSTPFGVQLHDDGLAGAFQRAGAGSISPNDVARIETHVCVITLRALAGSIASAAEMMNVATAVMKAGGMSVRVDSSGLVHGRHHWLRLTKDTGTAALYRAFVNIFNDAECTYSCGMHQLGYRDAIICIPMSSEKRIFHLNKFNGYVYQMQPTLADEAEWGDEVLRAKPEPCVLYPPGSLFHNPYGMWRITTIVEEY